MTEETGAGWSFSPGKACLNIFRFRDESLEESDNLPDPEVLAQEIIANDLGAEGTQKSVKIKR